MKRWLVSRLAQALIVLWLLATAVFLLVRLSPGDPTMFAALDPTLPAAARQLQAERFGLDQPIPVQYVRYLGALATGDLGVSTSEYPRSVGSILAERLPRTVGLMLLATVAAVVAGFSIGKRVAMLRNTAAEHAATTVAVVLHTAFPPWVALLMIWVFSSTLGWLPSGRFLSPAVWSAAPWSATTVFVSLLASFAVAGTAYVVINMVMRRNTHRRIGAARTIVAAVVMTVWAVAWTTTPMWPYARNLLWHTTLPTVTLMLLSLGSTVLLTRSSMLDVLASDAVFAARARGLSPTVIRDVYAAPAALPPVLSSLVLSLAAIATGSVIFEVAFSWPGLGVTLLNAVTHLDAPLAAGVLLTYAVMLLAGQFTLEAVWQRAQISGGHGAYVR